MKRDLITINDLTRPELDEVMALATRLKADTKAGRPHPLLAGRTMAMIFEKPSLRTRVTFETGMSQLGGDAVYLAPGDIELGVREPVADIAQCLARWVDVILARTFSHDAIVELAANATVPVINGLTDEYHPCQVLADCFTLLEQRGKLDGLHVSFVGDGNNMVHSWMLAAARFGFDFTLVCPPGYEPDPTIVASAKADATGAITVTHDLDAGTRGVDVLYTDVWTSMGQEAEAEERRRIFAPYQINQAMLDRAASDAIVMHCLPAHRGEEITAEVVDGPQSVVFEQAENRLHIQKAIVAWLLDGVEENR
ncbi:MAG: ornithine carbamoyltransferase [Hyphomicrobiaceae bacterium]|jgi:ornithine carbamoyltransferase